MVALNASINTSGRAKKILLQSIILQYVVEIITFHFSPDIFNFPRPSWKKKKEEEILGNVEWVIAKKPSRRARVSVMQLLQFSACHIADQRKLQAEGNKNYTPVQLNHLKVRNTIVFWWCFFFLNR